MSLNPKVSICIPSYNHARFLPAAIESALAQTYRSFEVVIVDDGSSDDSVPVAEAYAARYPALINVLTHPGRRHLGIGRTANLARRNARGEFWSGLPSDDVLYPQKLEEQVALFDRHPNLGWVYGYADIIDDQGKSRPGMPPFGEDITLAPNPLTTLIERNVVPAMTVLARRARLDEIGSEDESLLYSDWYYWIRLLAHSEVAFIDRPLAGFRVHGENTSEGVDLLENLQRGLEVMRLLQRTAPAMDNELSLPRTRSVIELQLCYHLFHLQQRDAARQSFWSALDIDPTLARDSAFFSGWLRARTLETVYRFCTSAEHTGFVSWLLKELSPFATEELRPPLIAASQAEKAFEHAENDRATARKMALSCVMRDPGWLKDRALRSVLLESFIGRQTMERLRRVKNRLRN